MRHLAGNQANEKVVQALDAMYIQDFQFEMEIWNVLKNLNRI
jgi:hypothetical protein